jgi:hypothetical protein
MAGAKERWMDVELAIASLCCFLLAFGHAAIGMRWILPNLTSRNLPGTPFGSPRLTLGMVRFTWDMVSVLLFAFGVLLTTLAVAPGVDQETLILRWLSVLWLAAGGLAVWSSRRRLRNIIRFPVPLLMFVVAAMCWAASI